MIQITSELSCLSGWELAGRPFHCSRRTCQSLVHPALDTIALCRNGYLCTVPCTWIALQSAKKILPWIPWHSAAIYILLYILLSNLQTEKHDPALDTVALQWNWTLGFGNIQACNLLQTILPWIPLHYAIHLDSIAKRKT